MMQFEQGMMPAPDGQMLSSNALEMTFPLWGVHSLIHIAGIDPKFRFLSLLIQLSCLLALTTLALF
jgi:hypothetical protein